MQEGALFQLCAVRWRPLLRTGPCGQTAARIASAAGLTVAYAMPCPCRLHPVWPAGSGCSGGRRRQGAGGRCSGAAAALAAVPHWFGPRAEVRVLEGLRVVGQADEQQHQQVGSQADMRLVAGIVQVLIRAQQRACRPACVSILGLGARTPPSAVHNRPYQPCCADLLYQCICRRSAPGRPAMQEQAGIPGAAAADEGRGQGGHWGGDLSTHAACNARHRSGL